MTQEGIEPKCENCQHWHEGEGFPEPDARHNKWLAFAGHCRRYPPSTYLVKDAQPYISSIWPGTHPSHWCGEFTPKQEAPDPWGEEVTARVIEGSLS